MWCIYCIPMLNTSHDLPYFPNSSLQRIIGGTSVEIGELPYQISFKSRHPDDQDIFYTFCGGAVIGESKLLSAAHCFVAESTGLVTICYGHTFLESLHEKYAVAGTIRNFAHEKFAHEQWRTLSKVTYPQKYKFPQHDLAIVFVKDPFVFNDYVKPIKYARTYEDYEGFCLVSGYGRISQTLISDSLLQAYLLLYSQNWCNKIQGRDMSESICTSVINSDIAKGDSGGPLVCTRTGLRIDDSNTLVGIASGTYIGLHSVFVRISAYHQFIERNHCAKGSSVCYFTVNALIVLPNYIGLSRFDLFVFY